MAEKTKRIRLIHGWGFRDTDTELYGFDGRRPASDASDFLGYRTYLRKVRPILNNPAAQALTENKWAFYRLASSYDLPIPSTIGLYDPTFGVTWDGRALTTPLAVLDELVRRRPGGIVIKPAGAMQAQQLHILPSIDYGAGRATSSNGDDHDLGDLLSDLPASNERGYPGHVIQEMVHQHPTFAEIAPTTVNTIRLVTLLTMAGTVDLQMGVVRFGRSGNTSDAWALGGVSVAIDLATGVLGEGVLKPKHGGHRVTGHPDTGHTLAGVQIPHWKETVDLVRRAGRLFPGTRSLGWDIVPTENGPVILETNLDWDLQMVQVHTDGYLALPGVRAELKRQGVELPTGSWVRPWMRSKALDLRERLKAVLRH